MGKKELESKNFLNKRLKDLFPKTANLLFLFPKNTVFEFLLGFIFSCIAAYTKVPPKNWFKIVDFNTKRVIYMMAAESFFQTILVFSKSIYKGFAIEPLDTHQNITYDELQKCPEESWKFSKENHKENIIEESYSISQ